MAAGRHGSSASAPYSRVKAQERQLERQLRRAQREQHKLSAPVAPAGAGPGAGGGGGPRPHAASAPIDSGKLVSGLLLALGSAALINLGFLLQHRGLSGRRPGGLAATLRQVIRNRTWLAGQVIGWIGFGAQIVAVAIAPLSLVQAFAAGGLALSVPLAAGIFSQRITRTQLLAVLLMAAALAVLPIGFSTGADHLHAPTLIVTSAVVGARRRGADRAEAPLAAGRRRRRLLRHRRRRHQGGLRGLARPWSRRPVVRLDGRWRCWLPSPASSLPIGAGIGQRDHLDLADERPGRAGGVGLRGDRLRREARHWPGGADRPRARDRGHPRLRPSARRRSDAAGRGRRA